jgi:hypothetical protein
MDELLVIYSSSLSETCTDFQSIFGLISLPPLIFFQRLGKSPPFVVGLNTIFLLYWPHSLCTVFQLDVLSHQVCLPVVNQNSNGSIALITHEVIAFKSACDFETRNLFITYCSLPRAILVVEILIWYESTYSLTYNRLLFWFTLGFAILNMFGIDLPSTCLDIGLSRCISRKRQRTDEPTPNNEGLTTRMPAVWGSIYFSTLWSKKR